MNDKIKTLICLLSTIALITAIVLKNYIEKEENNPSEDALKIKEEYESLNGKKNSNGKEYPKVEINEDNPIVYANYKTLTEVIEKGTGIIFLGFPECPWCRNALPVLIDAAKDAGVEKVYYMNIHDERSTYEVENGTLKQTKKGTEGYYKLLNLLDDYLDDYSIENMPTGEKRIYAPSVIYVKDGKVLGIHVGTIDSQKDPYKLLNDSGKDELYTIYTNYIHQVLGDICDEAC